MGAEVADDPKNDVCTDANGEPVGAVAPKAAPKPKPKRQP